MEQVDTKMTKTLTWSSDSCSQQNIIADFQSLVTLKKNELYHVLVLKHYSETRPPF